VKQPTKRQHPDCGTGVQSGTIQIIQSHFNMWLISGFDIYESAFAFLWRFRSDHRCYPFHEFGRFPNLSTSSRTIAAGLGHCADGVREVMLTSVTVWNESPVPPQRSTGRRIDSQLLDLYRLPFVTRRVPSSPPAMPGSAIPNVGIQPPYRNARGARRGNSIRNARYEQPAIRRLGE
jgi:hypothetical protein